MPVWERRKGVLYRDGSAHEVSQTSPTYSSNCEVNDTECHPINSDIFTQLNFCTFGQN